MPLLSLLPMLLPACGVDSTVKRINASPEVEILLPEEAMQFRQPEPVLLSARFADDQPLSELSVRYRLDGGEWVDSEMNADGLLEAQWSSADLAWGEHRLEVSAEDADGGAGIDNALFTVAGLVSPPLVEITTPADASEFLLGDIIPFSGQATDEATLPEELVFSWNSDIQPGPWAGVSGGGLSNWITGELIAGTHVITLSATDTDGDVGTDQITITITDGNTIPIPPEPGDLIFTEFMVNPDSVEDHYGEWVEMYNTSGQTLDITGYSFHDDASDLWVFDQSVLVQPHGYLVLCAHMSPAINGGVPCDGWFYRQPMGEAPPAGWGHGSGVAIANNDDELVLTAPDGTDIDVFDYNDTDSDPIEAAMSFGLDPGHLDGQENDLIRNWCVQYTIINGMTEPGTPGQANDPC